MLFRSPTGARSPGSIRVDYIHAPGGVDPQLLVGAVGTAAFGSPGFSLTRNVILESATAQVRMGDVVRGSIRFVMTDYYV